MRRNKMIELISEEVLCEGASYATPYLEIEFDCVNSETHSPTTIENQAALYQALVQYGNELLQRGLRIEPYRQDFSDATHTEISLAVILLFSPITQSMDVVREVRKHIKELAKQHKIKVDLESWLSERIVDQRLEAPNRIEY